MGGVWDAVLAAAVGFVGGQGAIVLDRHRAKKDARATAEAKFDILFINDESWLVTNVGNETALDVEFKASGASIISAALLKRVVSRQGVDLNAVLNRDPATLLVSWTSHRGERRGPVPLVLTMHN